MSLATRFLRPSATSRYATPMTQQPGEETEPTPSLHDATRRASISLRSMGQPDAVAREFDFSDDRYEGRRLFSELLGTFLLVFVAVGGGMVNARFGGNAVPPA